MADFEDHAATFIGHLLWVSFVFSALLILAWGTDLLTEFLNSLHALPTVAYHGLKLVKFTILGVDIVLCLILIGAGAYRFVTGVLED